MSGIIHTTVFALFSSRSQVEAVVNALDDLSDRHSNISVLIPFNVSLNTLDFMLNDAGAGAIMGATLGRLENVVPLVLPRIGSIMATGSMAHVLASNPGHGVSEALLEMGIPGYEASRYESRVKHGKLLISVQSDSERIESLEYILRDGGGEDMCSTSGTKAADLSNAYERA